MNSQMIKCFNAVCQTRNFTKAAEQLYISQSSLSKCLKALEDEVGCQLIYRNRTPVSLTSAGVVFAKYANKLTRTHNDMLAELLPYRSNVEQRLRVSAIPLVLDYAAVRAITTFQAEHTKMKIDYFECDQKRALQALDDNTADVSIVRTDMLNLSLYDYTVIYEEELAVVCSTLSPISRKETVSLSELKDEPFITYDDSSALYSFVVSTCESKGFIPSIVNTSSRVNIVLGMISESDCVSLLPIDLAKNLKANFPVSIIRLSDPIISKIAFVKPKASGFSEHAVASAFWTHLQNIME